MEPVEALVISSDGFLDFLVDHPHVALHLLRMLTGGLRDADRNGSSRRTRHDRPGRSAPRGARNQYGAEGDTGVVIDLPSPNRSWRDGSGPRASQS